MIAFVILAIVILQSASDAVRAEGKETLSKIMEVCYIALAGLGWLYLDITHHEAIAYVLLRMSLYVIVYNRIRKLKWYYMGKTAIYDRVINYLYGPLVKWIIVLTFAVGLAEIWHDSYGNNIFEFIWDLIF